MKFSIIIPVYNIEQYLSNCIESILKQSFKEYELILINDGSTDSSGDICDKYAKNNKCIKVIHQANGGAAVARNAGIKVAKNDYIFFIDSDDFIDNKNAFNIIHERLKQTKAEVLNFNFKKYYDVRKQERYFNIDENMPLEYLVNKREFEFLYKNDLYIAAPWNKVIKREMFNKYDLKFVEGIYSEDIEWCARLAIYAQSFDFIKEDFYCYRQIPTSVSKSISNKNLKDLKDSIVLCYEKSKELNTSFKKFYLNYVSYQYATFFVCQAKVKLDKKNKLYIDQMKKYLFLLSYGKQKKVKVLYILSKIIGYKNLCRLMRIFYGVK